MVLKVIFWSVLALFLVVLLMQCGKVEITAPLQEIDYKKFRLDRHNVIYEFTPNADRNKICVFVDGYNNGDLSCFDKR